MATDAFFTRLEALIKPGDKLLTANEIGDTWSYSRWVNYFLTQCGDGIGLQDRGRIYTLLLNLVNYIRPSTTLKFGKRQLELIPGSVLPGPLNPSFAGLVNTSPGGLPLDMLKFLLNVGFTAQNTVTARDVKMSSCGVNGEDLNNVFGNAFGLQAAMKIGPGERDARAGFLLFYRGDSRYPARVVQQSGATCRADLGFWREAAQVDAAWHPWNKSLGVGSHMWLRNGDKDNDYFTVNSVGLHFHISCAYPMLKLAEVDRSLTGHVSEWTAEKASKLRRSGKADVWRAFNRKKGAEEPVLVDKSLVYLCVFPDTTELSATYRKKDSYTGNTYPETGVRNVPLNQIVAWLEIERFHNNDSLRGNDLGIYGSTETGSTITIKVLKWGWLSVKEQGKNILGLENPSTLAQRLQGWVGKTFEIDHSRLISEADTTYDPNTKKYYSLKVEGVKVLKLH